MKKRALISVSNKENIAEFAKGLISLDYEIISTGGTLSLLKEAGIPAQGVEDITGFPEILDGRVKTLHPNVHGGLLAKKSEPSHEQQLKENKIDPIDVVVVNLYPFKETLAKEGDSNEEIIENIDTDGQTMLKAADKNFTDVAIVVDTADYEQVLAALKENKLDREQRQILAAKVFSHTANYDAMIPRYLSAQTNEDFP